VRPESRGIRYIVRASPPSEIVIHLGKRVAVLDAVGQAAQS
jgi:hypothetical protein